MNKYLKNLCRIEFVVTTSCTGKCKHCSQGEHTNCSGHIKTDVAVGAVEKVCEKYKIESLMTFGGEPLLYPEVVCEIHRAAKQAGIEKRDLITNGYFSTDTDKIKQVVRQLYESGVSRVLLSVDAFHQETIPIEPVKAFAEYVSKSNMEINLNPAWLVSKTDENIYNLKTKEIINEFSYLNIPTGYVNVVFPEGNALKYLKEYFDGKDVINPYEEDPRDIRTISFLPGGDVLNGNVYQNNILDILHNYHY